MKKRIIYDVTGIIAIEDINLNSTEITHHISENVFVVYDEVTKIKQMLKSVGVDHSSINEDGTIDKTKVKNNNPNKK